MIHYYCFIETDGKITPETRVFKVAVGDNQRAQVKRMLLDCYAADTNAFFRIWDGTTDYHLSQMATHKTTESHSALLGLNVVRTDIQTIYQKIIAGELHTLQNPPSVSRNAFRLLSIISPRFIIQNHASRRVNHVPAVSRKNLSGRPTREDHVAAVGFALMAILYWLGSLIGCWEASVL